MSLLPTRLDPRRFGRGGRPLRIAYGRLFHEACAYSPLLTERDSFTAMHHIAGDELAAATTIRGKELASFMPHAELTGFVQAARLAGNVDCVPLASSLAIPSGPLSAACFQWLVDDLVDRVQRADRVAGPGSLDGVYLALHGSMQVEGLSEAPESVIIGRVRDALGANAQIAVSYDLHANLSPGLVDTVDILIGYRSNPHWDLAPTGFRAGNRMIRSLRGQVRPIHSWRKLPMLLGGGMTIDFLAPMRGVFRWMKKLEDDPRVLSASLFMVHPYTSADDLGWAAHVCTDGDEALGQRLADQLADRAWAQRNVELPPMRTIDDALDEVARGRHRLVAPVTLVDVDDIVGAGAPGGNTHFVDALVRNGRGLKTFVPVHDPALLNEVWDVADGSQRHVTLRGTPGYGMPEVALNATVGAHATTDFGRIVRLDVDQFHVAVTERPPLPIHPSYWRELGLEPRRADAIVQKNFFHYRIFYAATSFRHIAVVSQGATSLDRVRNLDTRVPSHPRVKLDDWRDADAILRGTSLQAAA